MESLLTPDQLCLKIPGTTVGYWAQLRFTGKGPKFLKPSARKVLYREGDVLDWLEASERQGTAMAA